MEAAMPDKLELMMRIAGCGAAITALSAIYGLFLRATLGPL